MTVQESLLALFEQQRGLYLSGEEIATRLGVSRAAVWKAVKQLQQKGYVIDAVPNRGYCLSTQTDRLSEQGILKYLTPSEWHLTVLSCVPSTHALAREQAAAGAPSGSVWVAGEQTEGRGRRGRTFFSPADTGLYMSLVLRPPHCTPQQATRLTALAAVSVCEAMESVSDETPQIKWINDIYVRQKKVCGILTEASLNMEDGSVEYLILSIGVNVTPPHDGFPHDLLNIAGSLYDSPSPDAANHLAAEILIRLHSRYPHLNESDWLYLYRTRNFVLGHSVELLTPNGSQIVTALDINDSGHLIVQDSTGRCLTLSSGEISIRAFFSVS